ncbi:MAG: hypothetical protein QN172_08530 [Armatimonadota bacterium]|nr:hypothetical protein [Armatimonadota bacterium]MDR7440197.1 hypothetical protein [Armatimonadota bacterium]MDR7562594.1 hypothetical protein [Armatimonadota bacterium]MDR7567837.1 hypothetical protein [Armatimonadota bacterium]MDR7602488.1 hypothetical protein [Armatimonadota bacterium]
MRQNPRFGAEVVGILAQTLSPRAELIQVLEEIRNLREDFNRRLNRLEVG